MWPDGRHVEGWDKRCLVKGLDMVGPPVLITLAALGVSTLEDCLASFCLDQANKGGPHSPRGALPESRAAAVEKMGLEGG